MATEPLDLPDRDTAVICAGHAKRDNKRCTRHTVSLFCSDHKSDSVYLNMPLRAVIMDNWTIATPEGAHELAGNVFKAVTDEKEVR